MTLLQQCSFVSAPSFTQYAGVAALDVKVSEFRADYRRKRDMVYDELKGRYVIEKPQGAFYFFPKCPGGLKDTEFVRRAIDKGLLIVPRLRLLAEVDPLPPVLRGARPGPRARRSTS